MNCLIVDDEPIALKVLESHLQEFSDLNLIAKCRSALEAFELIQKNRIDVIFLDIEMPKLDGLSFLRSLDNPPLIVITTAHRDFAIDGFELNVVDYLLKPISLKRMIQAISKVKSALGKKNSIRGIEQTNVVRAEFSPYIFIRSERENVKVDLESILFVEGLKNHVKIVLENKTYVTLMNLGKMEDRLPRDIFIRIHKSFLINIHSVQNYTNTYVAINKKSIPIGASYRERVLEIFGKNQL